ncbi:2-hydroxyacyl-CoA dehydratase family protein, partial [Sphingomonas sp. CCH9-E2]|uniref:2-hydroxyacyl-CoA dehydratase family protein n=1 Tax=Sphingomonas sp. CCH9-E2 TaxID=1768776 RepID=UPI000AB18B32
PAVVNANSPQEILRAMDVPFVVNQWWASIVAAKQQSPRYFQLLRDHGYPSDAEAYSAQGIAAMFDADAEQAPWGGLPRPSFVQAPIGTDATPRIFDHWARETGAKPFLFERSIESRIDFPVDWWDRLHDDWDSAIEPERLDLMTAELREVIARIEATTDRRFDPDRFAHIMDLVNEQEDYYRRTRDLIAGAHPAPVSISDTMPATMVPQWHRGTEWARDAARDFYHEVKARHEAGEAACANEKLRLMWVGRGMWSDMGFTQRWEESHGAVFVWSMYLALAADGYIRRTAPGQDPLRALAARFVTMGDELRMPTWAGAWHVREAQSHAVDGAVALSDADPFVLRALRRAGVPVLSLDLDNYNREASDGDVVDRQIVAFLEGPVSDYAARRG